MRIKFAFFGILILIAITSIQAQQKISGTIVDKQTNEPLSFSSIAIPNSASGTMTNAKGEFELQLKEGQSEIQVSYVGYLDTLISIDPSINEYEISLEPYTFSLTEIIVTSLTPIEYIIKALEKHPSLIPNQPFETQAFFASKSGLVNDNSNSYELHQAVYQTYVSDYTNDTLTENSQLILYKNIKEGEFTSILEKNKRLNKLAEKNTKDVDTEEDVDGTSDININDLSGGGPDQALKEAKTITQMAFFDQEYFEKFDYSFGEQTFYQDRELIKINFSNKRKVNFSFYNGSIYLDHNDLAIVAVDFNVRAKIPFYINALIKAFAGFTLKEVKQNVNIRNQFFENKWYPKELVSDLELTIKQKKELEVIKVAQVLNIQKINIADPLPIEEEKIFSEDLEYQDQIFPIPSVEWKDINVIKL